MAQCTLYTKQYYYNYYYVSLLDLILIRILNLFVIIEQYNKSNRILPGAI